MDDRGEKIITLAREMLRSGPALSEESEPNVSAISMSFKTLCLATVLTAFGSSTITGWALGNQRPINRYEKIELDALVFYAARLKNVDEQILRKDVEDRLHISRFDDITEQDFPTVRRYLQEKSL